MRNFKIAVKFDTKLLNKLKNNNNSGVEIHNRKHHFALHPIHLNDFNKSIKDVLNEGIAKYNKNLGGILLGYENIRLPEDTGLINYDSCYIHMDLEADFFVFKPEIDKEMQGVVNRKSKDHVGVLVYNAFNVSLPKPQSDEDWLGSSVSIGDEVLFRITYMTLSTYLPYIKGELISVVSKAADSNVEEKYLLNNKKKSNKKIIFDDEGTPALNNSTEEKELSESKHKSKKRKFDTSEEIAQDQQDSLLHVKKKKKRNNENKLEEIVQEQQILIPHHVQKKEKYKNESDLDDTRSQKHSKKKKQKVRKEKGIDDSSLTDFNLSDLFNETKISLPNIKTEIDSDENLINNQSNKKKRSKKLENNQTTAEVDIQNNLSEGKLKVKKEKLKQEDVYTHLSESFGDYSLGQNNSFNIKYENLGNDLDSSINYSENKKSKKRRNSFVELGSHDKKLERKIA